LKLFRLDEPWDSEHNLRLIQYIPNVFREFESPRKSGRTSILALSEANSLLSGDKYISPVEVEDSPDSLFVLAEVQSEKAIEWTRPDDLGEKEISQIGEWVRAREGRVFVGTADRKVRSVPADMPVDQWRKACNCVDGEPSGIEFEEIRPKSQNSKPR